MSTFKNYLSLIKFSHTIFAMPFAMIGFFIALPELSPPKVNGEGSMRALITPFILGKLCLVIICMITARSAAMAFNRYLDRGFDALNPRTAIREIPAGIVSARGGLLFTFISSLLFIGVTYFINPLCFYLSPIALFVVLFYSYTKRFTALCHLVLGIGLSLAPIGAYLAVTGSFSLLPIIFSFSVVFWVSGFDIIYAMQDTEFDQRNQLYSIPSRLGKKRALRVSELLHLVSSSCIIAGGYWGSFHGMYWLGALVFIGMLVYQHTLVKPNDLSKVNMAFMTANGIASMVFGILVLASLFLQYGW